MLESFGVDESGSYDRPLETSHITFRSSGQGFAHPGPLSKVFFSCANLRLPAKIAFFSELIGLLCVIIRVAPVVCSFGHLPCLSVLQQVFP
jgi:hypothetical protein